MGLFVLGDSGFAITPRLITPFDQSQVEYDPEIKGKFNYELSRARVRIEQIFGILKKKFPFIGYPRLCYSFEKHVNITESILILFNLLISINEINKENISRQVYEANADLETSIEELKEQH